MWGGVRGLGWGGTLMRVPALRIDPAAPTQRVLLSAAVRASGAGSSHNPLMRTTAGAAAVSSALPAASARRSLRSCCCARAMVRNGAAA